MTAASAPVQRLSAAIRYRTVTIRSPNPQEDPVFAEFQGLRRHLRSSYPRLAGQATWEETPNGALLLTWAPATAPREPPVLFSAHCDVVPAGDQSKWTHAPFSGDISEGFVWGRGTLDDKGPLLAVFEALESLIAEEFSPGRVVYVAVGYDEEAAGRGAAELSRTLAGRGVRLSAVFDEGSVIVERLLPSVRMPIAPVGVAEKGYLDVRIRATGQGGHSSMPEGHTSAGVLAAALARLESRPAPLRLTATARGFLRTLGRCVPGIKGWVLRRVGLLWPIVRRTLSRDRSIGALLRTTRAVTVLAAGQAENVIPVEAQAAVNVRILPGERVQVATEAVRRQVARGVPKGFVVSVSPQSPSWEPVPPCPSSGPIWEAVCAALESAVPGVAVAPFLTPGMTDSRSYAGIADAIYRVLPLVVRREDLGLIHGANERISLENYGRMIGYYRELIRRVAG